MEKPLFYDQDVTAAFEICGRNAYMAFNKTIRLGTVVWQQGDDQAGFRAALQRLGDTRVSRESWRLMTTRVRSVLSQEEASGFDNVLRLYTTNAMVDEYNYNRLVALNKPGDYDSG